jgi:hypothetical protein
VELASRASIESDRILRIVGSRETRYRAARTGEPDGSSEMRQPMQLPIQFDKCHSHQRLAALI